MAYAELHCHSNFSFLDGAGHPEELVGEGARIGLSGLGFCDHNGLYGVVRFAEVARAVGLPTVYGAELSLATISSGLRPDRLSRKAGHHSSISPITWWRRSRACEERLLAGPRRGL